MIVVIILAIAVLLLAVRLLVGKKVVHTHGDGNREMARRGIHCVKPQDREARQNSGLKIKEHTKEWNRSAGAQSSRQSALPKIENKN